MSISVGPNSQVWAIGKNGSSYWRFGISKAKPTGRIILCEYFNQALSTTVTIKNTFAGESWQNVEPPSGAHLKQIAVGENVVWALDNHGKLSVRREIQPNVFPEGTHWHTLPSMIHDPIHIGKYFIFIFDTTNRYCILNFTLKFFYIISRC